MRLGRPNQANSQSQPCAKQTASNFNKQNHKYSIDDSSLCLGQSMETRSILGGVKKLTSVTEEAVQPQTNRAG